MKNLLTKLKPAIAQHPQGISKADAAIATWFGTGLMRPAPGTLGSLAAVPFGYAINYWTHPLFLLIAAALLLIFATASAHKYGKVSESMDYPSIVVDEVVGMWIAGAAAFTSPVLWLLAFCLFRFFDVWKPWPASYFDKKSKNGLFVMMDDVIAGIYALLGVSIFAL